MEKSGKERRMWDGKREGDGRDREREGGGIGIGYNNQRSSLYKMLCLPICGRNAEVTKLRVILGYYSFLKTKTKRRVML